MTKNTLRDRVEQLKAYKALSALKFGPIANLRISKNIQMLEKEVGLLTEVRKSLSKIEGLSEYESVRTAICEEYCARKEDGSPIIINVDYAFPSAEVYATCTQKIVELNEKYSSVVKEKEAFELEYATLLNTVVDVPLQEVSISSCKSEFSADILEPIVDFLAE